MNHGRGRKALGWLGLVTSLAGLGGLSLPVRVLADPPVIRLERPDYGGSTRDRADQLLKAGQEQERAGNFQSAISIWLEAVHLYQQIGDTNSMGLVYNHIGVAHMKSGQLREAEAALRRRVALARDNRDVLGEIYGLNNLGTVILQQRHFDEAAQLFREAQRLARQANHLEGQGLSLSNLGLVSAQVKNYEQAIVFYNAALELRRQSRNQLGQTNTLNNLADAYRGMMRYKEAIAAHQEALIIANTLKDETNQFRALEGLIDANLVLQQYPNTFQLLDQRLKLAIDQNNRYQQLFTWQALAQLNHSLGNWAIAKEQYRKAIELARQLKDADAEINLLVQVHNLQLGIGKSR